MNPSGNHASPETARSEPEIAFYRRVVEKLNETQIPFLVGGSHMMEHYTGRARSPKDFDVHVRRADVERVLAAFSAAGYRTELSFPHWLGKIFEGERFVDVIFSSGNGICEVDDGWFENAQEGEVFGVPARFSPPEETIWSKAFIMERERYDGADVAHLLLACGRRLQWLRLLRRFGKYWPVLLSHLILFGFIYPSERGAVPRWVLQDLLTRLRKEPDGPDLHLRICQGTLFSRAQYLRDIEHARYADARLLPEGTMTAEEIAQWTEAAQKPGMEDRGDACRE